jgi:hypothetical protein
MEASEVINLVAALGAVLTAIFNFVHGRDDGRSVATMTGAVDRQREAATRVSDQLNDAFRDVRGELHRLIGVIAKLAGREGE